MERIRLQRPLSASALRILALSLMLLDHLYGTVVSGNNWMTYLGRMAFPIFAFQAAEGVAHTSNMRRYTLRLFLFALISEVPFDLMIGGRRFFPFHQNVIFTLLLGVLALWLFRWAEGKPLRLVVTALGTVALALVGAIGAVDYGAQGVMTVVLFGLCRGFRGAWIGQLIGMIAIHGFWMGGWFIPILGLEIPVQSMAAFALIPIWLYNGQKGKGGKWLQIGSYIFYPAHMLVLAGIVRFCL